MKAAALVAVLALVLPATSFAATPRASFNDIEDEVMCTTCRVPLNIAESPQASQEREEIRKLIAEGLTKQQILDRLKAEYGKGILADPPTDGFNVTTWLIPAGVVAVLLATLGVLVPRWRRDSAAAVTDDSGPTLSPADARRLEEDLARYDA